MPTITACIISKNEESLLPQCLSSISDWVDEIIIVDTGSTDRTIAIAKQYGAKVYTHLWQNDFSLHRNQSISYATGDWILIIDCDEKISSDMSKFKDRLAMIPDNVAALVVRVRERGENQSASWLGVRFFRRSSGVHYKGIVHNKVSYNGLCAATDVEMEHYGYSLDKDKMAAKRYRTESLLLERLAKDQKDHAALYYMCQMKVGERDYDSAESYGLQFFECVPVGPKDFQFYSVMYFYMSWIYLHKEDGGQSAAWASKGLEFYPDDLDLNFCMARIGYQSENDDWLKEYGEKYLKLYAEKTKPREDTPGPFASVIDSSMWQNRTIYTANENAAKEISGYMGGL